MTFSTIDEFESPVPACSVSFACSSKESSLSMTEEIPPLARLVAVSAELVFETMVTEPNFES